ncbi:MAG: class I SAM-dependent methyltransferase [Cyanobacteria bacterium]|nr:class I SAM-dependent methyltransferase [Cyanobacteriota bacterium]
MHPDFRAREQSYYGDIRAKYAGALDQFGDDLRSIFTPKGRQALRYRHMLEGLEFSSVLDFGCGTGLLKSYLDSTAPNVRYTGVDIVEGFVSLCQKKFAGTEFKHIRGVDDVPGGHDVVLIAGTFNMVPEGWSEGEYRDFVFDTLAALFDKANRYLVFDFLSEQVDYRQPTAFHPSYGDVARFISTRLSKRFEILQHYMPFEAAARAYKDQTITPGVYVFEDADA